MAISMSEEQLLRLCQSLTQNNVLNSKKSLTSCTARYNGTRNSSKLEEFLAAASTFVKCENITDNDTLLGLPLLLQDEAAIWWIGVKNTITTWEEFKSRIRQTFAPAKLPYQIYMDIFKENQSNNTPTDVFICKKRALLTTLPTNRHTEEQEIDLIFGLLNIQIRSKLHRSEINSFNDLIQKARSIEELISENRATYTTKTSNTNLENKNRPKCTFCYKLGHIEEECRTKKYKETSTNKSFTTITSNTTPNLSCYGCGKSGVVRSKCDICNKKNSQSFCSISLNIEENLRQRPAVQIEINNQQGSAFIDSGARLSVASKSLYEMLQRSGYHFEQRKVNVILADGITKTQNVQVTSAKVKLANKLIQTSFIVLSSHADNRTLLGVDFIEDANMILNLPQKTWHFLENPTQKYKFIDGESRSGPLINTLEIKENHSNIYDFDIDEILTPTKTPLTPDYKPQHQNKRNYSIDGIITPTKAPPTPDHKYDIIKSPPCKRSIFLDIATINIENLKLREDEGTNMDESKRTNFNNLLMDNADLFEKHGPPVEHYEHCITTSTQTPIASPPYRLSSSKKQILENEIKNMLENGIIEECESSWASPVVLIPKKDGTTRVCIDYRQLNAITTPDTYPMPRIDDLLHDAVPSEYMTSIDLHSGYWQIKMKHEDMDKTAFITPCGIYRFHRMPFGLRNAAATFQRLMDKVKTKFGTVKSLVYLDDLLILSPSFEEHLKDVKLVFEVLRSMKLRMNRKKCHFGRSSLKFLGHILSSEGIHTDPDKVSAIANMAPPKNLKHLKSFLQTCSWFRRFIAGFSKIAQPLSYLTKKDKKWIWESAQQEAFDELKNKLISAPILQQADNSLPFTIRTDASGYAIGAVLLQGEGQNQKPVEYISRLLISAERNYSTIEREALAVVWAVNKKRGRPKLSPNGPVSSSGR